MFPVETDLSQQPLRPPPVREGVIDELLLRGDTRESVTPEVVLSEDDLRSKTPAAKSGVGLLSILVWLTNVAKTATLINILNTCQKLCLIVWSLSGIIFVSQLKETTAPLLKIVDLFELALAPKAYPIYPTVLPPLEEYFFEESVKDSLPKKTSPKKGSH
jgi:hypothetical protein